MGAVVSQDFTSLSGLWGALAFHAITTGLGIGLVGKGMTARRDHVAPAG
jgi:hypothetical protein